MYHLKLLEDHPDKQEYKWLDGPRLDKRFNLNSCIKAGREVFVEANAKNPKIKGYGLCRKLPEQPEDTIKLDFVYLSKFVKLKKEEYIK